MDRTDKDLDTAFRLGLRVAEYVHGVSANPQTQLRALGRVLDALRHVAGGELTLLDQPEETVGGAPVTIPASDLPDRQAQREVAERLLQSMIQRFTGPEAAG
jgi:hypothetical protein